jgi:hypothetical protein
MSLKKINGALAQYLVKGKSPSIGIDGKVKPWDYNKTNRNRITGVDDRTGRGGWCYLGDGLETLTIGGAFSIDHIIADTKSGAEWLVDQDISGILSGRVLTFASGTRYKNIRAYVTSISHVNLRFRDVCEAEAGTIAFDQSDNGNDGTLSNASLHQGDSTVLFSHANDYGFRISGGAVVPIVEGGRTCVDGNPADYSGEYKPYLQIEGSPAASVLESATLTFSNVSPFTRPITVIIGSGTATGSYNSGTGVFSVSGAGTIEYLVVDGINVYLCSNAGSFFKWTQNSISYGITFSAVTWATTTNNNAFLQANGGTKHKILTGTSNQITYASTLTLSETVNNTFKFRTRVGWYAREGVQSRIPLTSNGGTGASARSNIFLDNAISVDPNEVTRTRLNIFLRSSVSFSLFSTPFTVEGSVSNFDLIEITLTLNTSDLVDTSIIYKIDNLTTGVTILAETTTSHDFSAVGADASYLDFTKSGLYPNDGANFDRCIEYIEINNGTDTVIYDVTTGTNTGTIAISSDQTEYFYLPSALDVSGNPTGLDVFGNQIPNPELIARTLRERFNNLVNRNPEGIPALIQSGIPENATITIEQFANYFGNIAAREEQPGLWNHITANQRGEQFKLVLDSTTDSNTITFAAGSFAANGIVSATATPAKTAITLGTDSITVIDGLELFYVRFLDAGGNVVDIVPCSEGSLTTIKSLRGLLTGTIGGTTTTVWQPQTEFDSGLLFGEEISGDVKYPGLVDSLFRPLGISAKSGSTGIDNGAETKRGQRTLNLTKKAL